MILHCERLVARQAAGVVSRVRSHVPIIAHAASGSRRGFSLIELMTVIAIIAILAALLIPTLSAARVSVRRAESKVRFNQWAVALEQFRQEYGYIPTVTSNDLLDSPAFLAALTGRDFLGNPLSGASLNGNAKALVFYSASESEFVRSADGSPANELCDAFGNSDIVILLDADGNGVINGAELVRQPVRAGNSRDGYGPVLSPPEENFPAAGIRARAILYSAGRGTAASDLVYSWK